MQYPPRFLVDIDTGDLSVNLEAANPPTKGFTYQVLIFIFDRPIEINEAKRAFATVLIFIAEVDPCFEVNFGFSGSLQVQESTTFPSTLFSISYTSDSFPVTASLLQVLESSTLFVLTSHPFILNNDTVYLGSELDFETITGYALSIYFSNSRSECDTIGNVTIEVINVNDVTPTIQPIPTQLLIENLQFLLAFNASDEDFLPLRYSVDPGPANNFLFIDSSQPILLIRELDRETIPFHQVTVFVEDNGTPPLSSSVVFQISVTDDNDNAPEFNQNRYFGSIPENQDGLVLTVNAVDIDLGTNAEIVFTMVSPTTLFSVATVQLSVGNFEGRINLNFSLDYETNQRVYSFLVKAEDRASFGQRLSSTTNVTVYILDVNDVPPIFINTPYSASVDEELDNGTVVFSQVSGFDPEEDENGRLVFTQNSTNLLGINSETGVIFVTGRLDRETTPQITITIRLYDTGSPPLSAVTTFTLTLLDVNDNPPVFIESPIFRSFPENTVVSSTLLNLPTLTTDADIGGSSTHSYIIVFSDSSPGVDTSLRIQNNKLVLINNFDFESGIQFYLFIINAFDGVNNRSILVVFNITDVNDNPPIFDFSLYKFSLTENNPITEFVGQVIARDLDSGINKEIDYSLPSTETRLFISPVGVIYTNYTFDRETVDNITFSVTATDRGLPPLVGFTSVNILILDEIDVPPVIIGKPFNFMLSENSSINFVIFTFTVSDPDLEPTPPLSIAGAGSSDFVLVGYELRVNTLLDRDEGQSFYSLSVTAIDTAGLEDTAQLNITLTDVNDNAAEFEQVLYSFSILEEEASIYYFGEVVATDIDSGVNAKFLYFIKEAKTHFTGTFIQSRDCAFSGTAGNVFNFGVGRNNGSLFVTAPVDYESVHFLSLSVCTLNTAPPYQERCICVVVDIQNINDVAPVFDSDQLNLTLAETEGNLLDSNRLVTSFSFLDLDGFTSDTYLLTFVHSYGAQFPFTFGSANTSVDNPDGSIEITRAVVTLSNVDRELRDVYQFQVCVFDGVFTEYAQIYLAILDVNDNPPIFPVLVFLMSVNEHEPVGFPIGSVNATDADINENSVINFYLVNGTEFFSINVSTGQLSVASDIDREPDNNTAILIVRAANIVPGVPNQFDVVTSVVYIYILDINDNNPQYDGPLTNSVFEDQLNKLLFSVSATDADVGLNAQLSFFIISDPDDVFVVNGVGIVRNDKLLIRDVSFGGKMFYYFTLLVIDNGAYPSSLNTTFEFTVTAINVNNHVSSILNPSFNVFENRPQGTCFGTLTVEDLDFPPNTTVPTEFATDSQFFSINRTTGFLCTKVTFDREQRNSYSVQITLIDLQPPASNTTEFISVNINDENDNPPSWLTVCPIEVQDSVMTAGTLIQHLQAGDPDTGPSLIYRIVGSDFGFSLSGSGLYPPSGADVSDTKKYWLTFSVYDSVHSPVLLDCIILVTDLNSYDPVLSPSEYEVTVIENIAINSVIVEVSAVDLDEGINGNVSFELLNELATFTLENDG